MPNDAGGDFHHRQGHVRANAQQRGTHGAPGYGESTTALRCSRRRNGGIVSCMRHPARLSRDFFTCCIKHHLNTSRQHQAGPATQLPANRALQPIHCMSACCPQVRVHVIPHDSIALHERDLDATALIASAATTVPIRHLNLHRSDRRTKPPQPFHQLRPNRRLKRPAYRHLVAADSDLHASLLLPKKTLLQWLYASADMLVKHELSNANSHFKLTLARHSPGATEPRGPRIRARLVIQSFVIRHSNSAIPPFSLFTLFSSSPHRQLPILDPM